MSIDTKMILEELCKNDAKWEKCFEETDSKWERRFEDLDTKWDFKYSTAGDVVEERMSKLEKIAAAYEEWQPAAEGALDDVNLEVRKLNKHLERVIIDQALVQSGGIFKSPESVSVRLSAGVHADGPSGHREDNRPREDGYGSVIAVLHPPVKGAYTALPSPQFNSVHNQIPSHGTRGGYSASEFNSMEKFA
jgi:hypothetical protein